MQVSLFVQLCPEERVHEDGTLVCVWKNNVIHSMQLHSCLTLAVKPLSSLKKVLMTWVMR